MTPGAWRRTLGFGVLCLAAPGAGALSLGAVELRSAAGAPLEARIPVHPDAGESPRGACFTLLPDERGAALPGASLELRHHARGADLYVRTHDALSGAAPGFAIGVHCPEAAASRRVEFSLRLAHAASAAALPVVANIAARDGDSFATLARAIFPKEDRVRTRYLRVLRTGNSALAALRDDEPLPAGARVALPDLHAFAATMPVHRAPPMRHVAVEPLLAAPLPAAPRRAPQPPAPASHNAGAVQDGFHLRLSAPVLDLAPSKAMDERRRAQLRERLLLLEADDRTAAMLAMRENIRRLESQVQALKLKLAAMPQAAALPPPRAPMQAAPGGPRVVARVANDEPWYSNAAWMLAALAAALALWLGMRLRQRRAVRDEDAPYEEELPALETTEPGEAPSDETQPPQPPEASALPLIATRVPAEDNAELRRRYMEERFPEIANGALALEDPRCVVHAAGLLYDDGAVPRAVELLHFAIEQDPDAGAPWLALFDIFRRERLAGEYAQLAARFHERHGNGEDWRKVRCVGRSIDPDHPLYEGAEFGAADPEAEGWLRPAGDDARLALAGELRGRLMAQARVCEDDLLADPTPALRKAEPFSVA